MINGTYYADLYKNFGVVFNIQSLYIITLSLIFYNWCLKDALKLATNLMMIKSMKVLDVFKKPV